MVDPGHHDDDLTGPRRRRHQGLLALAPAAESSAAAPLSADPPAVPNDATTSPGTDLTRKPPRPSTPDDGGGDRQVPQPDPPAQRHDLRTGIRLVTCGAARRSVAAVVVEVPELLDAVAALRLGRPGRR